MAEIALVVDLALAVLTAFAGGVVAQRLRQPVILGYLVAGVVIGPFTPGLTVDSHTVQVLAEIGVAFLMFAVGAELSLGELRRLGRAASLGGALQIAGTMALGLLLAPLLGLTAVQGLFLGALLSLSSTVVALKVLMARGEMQALHGRVALGILVAQDVAVVPMVVVLPALAAGATGLFATLGLAALKAAGILLGAYVLGTRVVPWVLGHVATGRSRELFVLGVVGLALGTALMTQLAGLSLAFGAFLAGLVVAESDYRTQAVAEVLPLRDLFASLFFVSVGMLINPRALLSSFGLIAALSAVAIVGKVLIVAVVVRWLGLPGRVAVLAGLSLAHVGEISFVLARIGVEAGAIPAALFDLTLAVALITIVLTPALLQAAPPLLRLLARLPGGGRHFAAQANAPDSAGSGMRGHTIICGYGRVGSELAAALDARGLPYLVVEYNPLLVRDLRARGVPVRYGDAANPLVLEHAHVGDATLLAVLMPDAAAAEAATRYGRDHAPDLDIVARARDRDAAARLRRAGATAVVQPEFEAGLEVIRHALRRVGVSGENLAQLTQERRHAFEHDAESPAAALE